MDELNEKVMTLTTRVEEQTAHTTAMRRDIHTMVDLLTEMVVIFRGAELPKESIVEKKVEEVDPSAAKVIEKVDLTGKSEDEEAEKDTSDHEEVDSGNAEKEVSIEDRD